MMTASEGIASSCAAPTMPRVRSVSGTCTERTWDRSSSSSKETVSMPSFRPPGSTRESKPITR